MTPFFAKGARGELITPLRKHFGLSVGTDPVFDEFDDSLVAKVKEYQAGIPVDATGRVDRDLYNQILGANSWPTEFFDLALMVIASIEGHGYFTKITPDRPGDPAGITAGIIGFTAKSGALLRVLYDIPAELRRAALTNCGLEKKERDLDDLLARRNGTTKEDAAARRENAISLFLTKVVIPPKKIPLRATIQWEVMQPWHDFLTAVLRSDAGREAQRNHARTEYFEPGLTAARKNGIESNYGIVLSVGIIVQAGSLKNFSPAGSDRERRLTVASSRSQDVPRVVVQNFESRHMGIAAGRSFPNKRFVDLSYWGLEDSDPVPPTHSRLLSLPFSHDATTSVLQSFEVSAATSSVIDERVNEIPIVKKRIRDAGGPFLDFSNSWLNLSKLLEDEQKANRARRIELYSEFNERPLSCLILGGARTGSSLLWDAAGAAGLSAKAGVLAWNAPDLYFPLCPKIQSGLVILVSPLGISKRSSFAKALQTAIGAINPHPPLVLGWEGPVEMPTTNVTRWADDFFAAVHAEMFARIPPFTLDGLVLAAPGKIIQAWGKACQAFATSNLTPALLYRSSKFRKRTIICACAALDPSGQMWRAIEHPAGDVFMEKVV